MTNLKKICVIGSGFSGAVIAHILANSNYKVTIFESRNHIGGNCFTYRDKSTGILVHKYGPHIFHTDNKYVWDFINKFSKFKPYINRVKSNVRGNIYSLPINLHTINQFFNKSFSPQEAQNFIHKNSISEIMNPISFEEQALKFVGKDLYEAFFKGYTLKQWGIDPKELPASILKRLPVRFNYNDNYFNHHYQGMPIDGYTPIFEKLVSHSNIDLYLDSKVDKSFIEDYDFTFYSGPIDEWFDFKLGKLDYRTLDFDLIKAKGDYQGCAVMNYPDEEIPFTRITEHKHFAEWENHKETIIFKEFSRVSEEGDIPYYPIRLVNDKEKLLAYIKLANMEKNVSFVGRLGTYRYLDMDVTIAEALEASSKFIQLDKSNKKIPAFFNLPL